MHLKLIYFDFPFWRAEVSRLALHLGGVPFEDVRPDTARRFERSRRRAASPMDGCQCSMSTGCASPRRSPSSILWSGRRAVPARGPPRRCARR